jgi:2-amino-4-hydroxy-6-hydroxymethyldihydropteridine diphosphokinase
MSPFLKEGVQYESMNKAYLLIGGNLGDRVAMLENAVSLIGTESGKILKQSFLYETASWGPVKQPDFLNQCISIETDLTAAELMQSLLSIEKKLGRVRREKWGPREIDIDMLLFNDLVIRTPLLSVPHPELANRRFALVPLNEIASDYVHPVRKKTISRMLRECKDPSLVQLRL